MSLAGIIKLYRDSDTGVGSSWITAKKLALRKNQMVIRKRWFWANQANSKQPNVSEIMYMIDMHVLV